MENYDLLKSILAEKGVAVDSLNEDSNLKELGLDSLDTVETLMDIEEKLKIQFETEELSEVKIIRDILNLIEKKTA